MTEQLWKQEFETKTYGKDFAKAKIAWRETYELLKSEETAGGRGGGLRAERLLRRCRHG